MKTLKKYQVGIVCSKIANDTPAYVTAYAFNKTEAKKKAVENFGKDFIAVSCEQER